MKHPKSMPLGFWRQTDLLEYLVTRQLPYPACYGEIVKRNGVYVTTEEKRTGCMCCLAGISKEYNAPENRFQRMQRYNPNHFKLAMTSLEDGGYGMKEVLEYMKFPYNKPPILPYEELMEINSF